MRRQLTLANARTRVLIIAASLCDCVRLFSALREYSVLAYLHVACNRNVAALFVQGSFTDFPIVRWFAVGLECLLFECTLRIDVIKTK